MHELYEIKEKLIDKLIEYGKGELSASAINNIDTTAHAAKNVCKVIEACEGEGYSERGGYSSRRYYRDGGSYDGNYDGESYARGRGRGAKRDSMGRYASYSRTGEDMATKLRDLAAEAPNNAFRQKIEAMLSEME